MWVVAGRFNLCVGVHLRHLGELYSFETELIGSLSAVGTVEITTHLDTLKRAWLQLHASNMPGPGASAGRAFRGLVAASGTRSAR